jgi:hypothetical protein
VCVHHSLLNRDEGVWGCYGLLSLLYTSFDTLLQFRQGDLLAIFAQPARVQVIDIPLHKPFQGGRSVQR